MLKPQCFDEHLKVSYASTDDNVIADVGEIIGEAVYNSNIGQVGRFLKKVKFFFVFAQKLEKYRRERQYHEEGKLTNRDERTANH